MRPVQCNPRPKKMLSHSGINLSSFYTHAIMCGMDLYARLTVKWILIIIPSCYFSPNYMHLHIVVLPFLRYFMQILTFRTALWTAWLALEITYWILIDCCSIASRCDHIGFLMDIHVLFAIQKRVFINYSLIFNKF